MTRILGDNGYFIISPARRQPHIAIISDAWLPQINGVVRTLMRTIEEQIGVSENAKKAFREEILIRVRGWTATMILV